MYVYYCRTYKNAVSGGGVPAQTEGCPTEKASLRPPWPPTWNWLKPVSPSLSHLETSDEYTYLGLLARTATSPVCYRAPHRELSRASHSLLLGKLNGTPLKTRPNLPKPETTFHTKPTPEAVALNSRTSKRDLARIPEPSSSQNEGNQYSWGLASLLVM